MKIPIFGNFMQWSVFSRQIALATATLLTFFAIAMTLSFGIKASLNYIRDNLFESGNFFGMWSC
jgi:hypothetical protein